jgi:hypothetical protein
MTAVGILGHMEFVSSCDVVGMPGEWVTVGVAQRIVSKYSDYEHA